MPSSFHSLLLTSSPLPFLPVAVPYKVREHIAQGKYVPYTAFSKTARARALYGGDESLVISATGVMVAKGLDRAGEESVPLAEWIAAAQKAVELTREYHGDARANALAGHHGVVLGLANHFNWDLADEMVSLV